MYIEYVWVEYRIWSKWCNGKICILKCRFPGPMQFIFVESEISISNGIHSNTFYFNRLHLNLAINFWSKSWSFYYFLKLRICIFSSTRNCRVYWLPKKISQYDWLNKNTINMLILRNFVSLLTLQIFYNWEKIWLYWMWICYILVKPNNFITSSNLFWIFPKLKFQI